MLKAKKSTTTQLAASGFLQDFGEAWNLCDLPQAVNILRKIPALNSAQINQLADYIDPTVEMSDRNRFKPKLVQRRRGRPRVDEITKHLNARERALLIIRLMQTHKLTLDESIEEVMKAHEGTTYEGLRADYKAYRKTRVKGSKFLHRLKTKGK